MIKGLEGLDILYSEHRLSVQNCGSVEQKFEVARLAAHNVIHTHIMPFAESGNLHTSVSP